MKMFEDDLNRFEDALSDYVDKFGLRAASVFLNGITTLLVNSNEKITKFSLTNSIL